MTPEDIERFTQEYTAAEPIEGRLARALQVDVPVWRELGKEILSDFDDRCFGVGWWSPHPGTSRRILISDHLFTCVRSVETHLLEARLHFVEAMDFWERESDFHARAASISRGGKLDLHLPERKRPLDEITSAMATLHTVGFISTITGALDCFGASVVGVLALRTGLLHADLASARKALAQISGGSAGERAQVQFSADLEALIKRVGPQGWLQWMIDLRNTLIHRGRRLEMKELRPLPSRIVDRDGRPVIRTHVIHQLPRDPGRSDVEMFLEAAHPPVLTESSGSTLRGVLDSTLRLIGDGGALLLNLWRLRRASPALLFQPGEQWPDGPSSATVGFAGYAPDSIPYELSSITSNPITVRRMNAASLGDAARPAWARFD